MKKFEYRSARNPFPATAEDIHYTLTNADGAIDSEVDNFSAIADLAIVGLKYRLIDKSLAEVETLNSVVKIYTTYEIEKIEVTIRENADENVNMSVSSYVDMCLMLARV